VPLSDNDYLKRKTNNPFNYFDDFGKLN